MYGDANGLNEFGFLKYCHFSELFFYLHKVVLQHFASDAIGTPMAGVQVRRLLVNHREIDTTYVITFFTFIAHSKGSHFAWVYLSQHCNFQLADMRIKFHANGSHFESVGFHHIKKCALLKQILLTLERFYLCEINVQVRAHTHSQTLTLLLVPALWVSTYISHVYPFFTFIPFQSHSSRLLSSCWSHRVLPYIFTCHPPEYDDYDNDELQHINELFCQTK